MSGEAAVYRLLTQDPVLLEQWGIGEDQVYPQHSLDSPLRRQHFLVLRWGESQPSLNLASTVEVLTVWVHMAKQDSTDYLPLRQILGRVEEILTDNLHVSGEDGTLTTAKYRGTSANLDDPIFGTITKNAEFSVVTR